MNLKKLMAIALVGTMTFSLAACSGGIQKTAQSSATVTDTVESQTNTINDLNLAANILTAKSAQLTELLGKFKV